MKFTAEKNQIVLAIQNASSVAERKSTMPILANMLIKTAGGLIEFTATDLEIQVKSFASVIEIQAEGEITVSARKMAELCKSLPDNEKISFFVELGKLAVRAKSFQADLSTISAADFPQLECNEPLSTINMPKENLSKILNKTHFSMATQDHRPYLNGLLLEFKEGKISVQDPAAGLVVQLVDPQIKESIIDSCAAPGGKSSYMAEKMNNTGSILSLDSNEGRLNKLDSTISRLHITNIETDLIDITKDTVPMTDKMLLDVPCSGTGVMSKQADIRWRRSIEDILEMHLLQRKILWSASNYIKTGGIIIYSTCSLEPEENWMVVEAFLKSHPDFSIESAKE